MKILMTVSNPFVHDLRVYYEAKTLVEAGHQVIVAAWDRFNQFDETEIRDGIQIKRFSSSKFMKLLWRKPFQLPFFWRKVIRWALTQKFDAVHCHDLDTIKIGLALKPTRNFKLVYDAHEIFTFLIQRDLTRIFTGFYKKLEKEASQVVNELIIADESYIEFFTKLGFSKITTVLNTKPILSEEYIPSENQKLKLIYIGTLTRPRFLIELIQVVKDLPEIDLEIAGIGPLATKIADLCEPVENIQFLGPVPAEKVLSMTRESDVVVCMIDPSDDNNRIASANKQFEAMVCGRPIIATKGTRSGQITEEENCGLVIDFTKEALKSAILELAKNLSLREELGKNALQAALNKYNWQIDSAKLIDIYEE